jgi:hypothetical protein
VCTDRVDAIRKTVEDLQKQDPGDHVTVTVSLRKLMQDRNFNEIVKRYRTLEQARTRVLKTRSSREACCRYCLFQYI